MVRSSRVYFFGLQPESEQLPGRPGPELPQQLQPASVWLLWWSLWWGSRRLLLSVGRLWPVWRLQQQRLWRWLQQRLQQQLQQRLQLQLWTLWIPSTGTHDATASHGDAPHVHGHVSRCRSECLYGSFAYGAKAHLETTLSLKSDFFPSQNPKDTNNSLQNLLDLL